MNKYKIAFTLLSSIAILSACEKRELWIPKVSGNGPPKIENLTETQDGNSQVNNIKSTRREIDKLKNEIDRLEEKSKQSDGKLKSSLEKKTQMFRDDLKIIEKKWQEMKEASTTSWKKSRDSLKTLIDKLDAAIREA